MGKKSLANAVEGVGALAGALPFIPGAPVVSALANPVANVLRALGISRVSAEAMAAANRRGKGGKAGRARRRRGGGGVKMGGSPAQYNPGVGVREPTLTPALYTRSKPLPGGEDGVRLEGCEPMTMAAGSTDANGFYVSMANALSPATSGMFPWLSTQSPLWTKCKFRMLRLHIIPVEGSTTAGTTFSAYTPDPELGPPTTQAQVQTMAQKSVMQVWKQHALEVKLKVDGVDPFFIDADGADNRLEQQGSVFLGYITYTPSAAVSLFQAYVEYEVDLLERKVTALTLLSSQYLRGLHNVRFPDEFRVKCGMAYVDLVLKELRPKTRRDKDADMRGALELAMKGGSTGSAVIPVTRLMAGL